MIRLAFFILLFSVIVSACAPADAPPPSPEPAAEVAATDDDARVELTLSTDRTELTTLDRLEVTITLRRPIANTVTLIEPDWEAAGWTRIDSTDSLPVAIDTDHIERFRIITIEPFLAGDYTIPPATIEWTTGTLTRILQTPELSATVTSVLADSDSPELAEPTPIIPPVSEKKEHSFTPLLISIAVLVGALLLINAARRAGREDDKPTPLDTIRAIANNEHESDTPLADLHRALATAEPMPSSKHKLNALIARCEIARFTPADRAPVEQPDPKQLASAALEIIVTDRIEPAPNTANTPIGGAA